MTLFDLIRLLHKHKAEFSIEKDDDIASLRITTFAGQSARVDLDISALLDRKNQSKVDDFLEQNIEMLIRRCKYPNAFKTFPAGISSAIRDVS